MKARHIRKFREKVKAMRLYHVTETNGLFGDFPYITNGHLIKACSPREAIIRYQRWYFRKNKQRCRSHTDNLVETIESFGKFRVIDEKGYHRYYF